jgi:hypothetical protein
MANTAAHLVDRVLPSAHAVSAPTATGTADRAPPNPYAH